MVPGARCRHDELFPGHVSTLAQTDPELIGYFDNFAFGDVLQEGSLTPRTRLMVQFAARMRVVNEGASEVANTSTPV